MASGDPPITGNPADSTGTITIVAKSVGNTDNMLRVRLTENKSLQMILDKGDHRPITIPLNRDRWHMIIEEIP